MQSTEYKVWWLGFNKLSSNISTDTDPQNIVKLLNYESTICKIRNSWLLYGLMVYTVDQRLFVYERWKNEVYIILFNCF